MASCGCPASNNFLNCSLRARNATLPAPLRVPLVGCLDMLPPIWSRSQQQRTSTLPHRGVICDHPRINAKICDYMRTRNPRNANKCEHMRFCAKRCDIGVCGKRGWKPEAASRKIAVGVTARYVLYRYAQARTSPPLGSYSPTARRNLALRGGQSLPRQQEEAWTPKQNIPGDLAHRPQW